MSNIKPDIKTTTQPDINNHVKLCIQRITQKKREILMEIDTSKSVDKKKLKAAFFTSNLWPDNSKINIGFLDEGLNIPWTSMETLKSSGKPIDSMCNEIIGMKPIDAIKKVVNERIIPITGNVNINFVDDPKDANIRIAFDPNAGSWSYLGTQNLEKLYPEPTMNFGWIDAATIEHEFGHLLGMIHEHQNPSENPIQWDKEKVYKWALDSQGWDKDTTDANILHTYESEQINGSVFDPTSIMLYFFPADLTMNGKGTAQNLMLSGTDVTFINQMYPNSEIKPSEFYKKVYNQDIDENIKNAVNTSLTGKSKLELFIKKIIEILFEKPKTNESLIIKIIIILIFIYFIVNLF